MAPRLDALRAGLRELGYREGRDIAIEHRWANDRYDRLPGLAAELVGRQVAVLVTHGAPGARAARAATSTIPIVVAGTGDAIAMGFSSGLSRPSENVTGLTYFIRDLYVKRLELLKEGLPKVVQVAILLNPRNPANAKNIDRMESAAKLLGVRLSRFEAQAPSQLDPAFAAMAQGAVEAVHVIEDGTLNSYARRIASLANRHRLPSVGFPGLAEAGGLLGYGVEITAVWRRSAYYVDKLLKGARLSDLPWEQPTTFTLAVNAATARDLGLKLAPSLLLRATRVIE